MGFRGYPSAKMSWIESQIQQKDGILTTPSPPLPPGFSPPLSSSSSFPPPYGNDFQKDSPSSSGSKINPAVLFIIVILAVLFFISGLLHLLVRFLIKQPSSSPTSQSSRYPDMSGSDALQRQLQQLFHLHDSGLDQAFIDALPVFLYKEIMGLKEPFDCAVCLCEFSEMDKLRLLPMCSHAFHIHCIDTWLLSNSTCPLCRGTLLTPGLSIENPVFDFDLPREEDGQHGDCEIGLSSGEKPLESEEIGGEKRVYHVRLGKFKSVNNGAVEVGGGVGGGGGGAGIARTEAETSSSNLDARRCYSMGSFQYVVGETNLQVALCHDNDVTGNLKIGRGRGTGGIDGDFEGKKLSGASKGESFSVSKIWLWSKKGNYYPSSSNTHASSLNLSMPWTAKTQGGL